MKTKTACLCLMLFAAMLQGCSRNLDSKDHITFDFGFNVAEGQNDALTPSLYGRLRDAFQAFGFFDQDINIEVADPITTVRKNGTVVSTTTTPGENAKISTQEENGAMITTTTTKNRVVVIFNKPVSVNLQNRIRATFDAIANARQHYSRPHLFGQNFYGDKCSLAG